jgi:hypothetical protein
VGGGCWQAPLKLAGHSKTPLTPHSGSGEGVMCFRGRLGRSKLEGDSDPDFRERIR